MTVIRLFLLLAEAATLAAFHALPFMPRPDRLFGVAVPREIRYGQEGRRMIRRYQLALLPWSCAALLFTLWLPSAHVSIWLPAVVLVPPAAALWNFQRQRAAALHLASPAPSEREAVLAPGGGHFRRLALFLIPLAILGGTALYLHLHWEDIPARFPVHWGAGGAPDRWSTRTPAGVYGPLLIGGAVVCFLAAVTWLTAWGSRRTAQHRAALLVPLAVSYVIAAAFSMAGLLPLHIVPLRGLLAFHAATIGLLAVVTWVAVRHTAAGPEDVTPEECWRWGQFYYNPDDPALFVEKRAGLGWTLNFGNRLSWLVLALLLLVPAAIVSLAFAFAKA